MFPREHGTGRLPDRPDLHVPRSAPRHTATLPADSSVAPTVLDYDEYGNPRAGQDAVRYGWLGGKQRSSETLTGLTLMGVRLYNPTTGRFLSIDPVPGGSANAYEYGNGDPVNNYDLDGRSWWRRALRYYHRRGPGGIGNHRPWQGRW
ncbi:RHS repeat-associated core domain-containing protein [Streptomyces sp. NPDC046942]|uniref:RHS repeat-associated core domain-containing protein n=1 Tax=Streptomyces sp. NPDC046942 TaxID=3155137 RepID=UPI0033E7D77C